ncbi:hypothetical protein FRC07_015070 [Ceratobasidium sp. 392]|nr:hypothetical protein FRC07_015070 [Ceratobasidium sp. 392]
MPFQFKPFTNDLTPHAQLQEWADYYHIDLKWAENKTQKKGITEWSSYPISTHSLAFYRCRGTPTTLHEPVQKKHYSNFVGIGGAQKHSRAAAAELIIACPTTL